MKFSTNMNFSSFATGGEPGAPKVPEARSWTSEFHCPHSLTSNYWLVATTISTIWDVQVSVSTYLICDPCASSREAPSTPCRQVYHKCSAYPVMSNNRMMTLYFQKMECQSEWQSKWHIVSLIGTHISLFDTWYQNFNISADVCSCRGAGRVRPQGNSLNGLAKY